MKGLEGSTVKTWHAVVYTVIIVLGLVFAVAITSGSSYRHNYGPVEAAYEDVWNSIVNAIQMTDAASEAQQSVALVIIDAVLLDDDPTTYTSGAINIHGFSTMTLLVTVDSTAAPTSVSIWCEYSLDGTSWYGANSATQGVPMIDSNGNWVTQFAIDAGDEVFDLPDGSVYLRVTATATGTDATNKFLVTAEFFGHGR